MLKDEDDKEIKQKLKELDYVGYCHYCYEPLEHNKKFCDKYCRDSLEKELAEG